MCSEYSGFTVRLLQELLMVGFFGGGGVGMKEHWLQRLPQVTHEIFPGNNARVFQLQGQTWFASEAAA